MLPERSSTIITFTASACASTVIRSQVASPPGTDASGYPGPGPSGSRGSTIRGGGPGIGPPEVLPICGEQPQTSIAKTRHVEMRTPHLYAHAVPLHGPAINASI